MKMWFKSKILMLILSVLLSAEANLSYAFCPTLYGQWMDMSAWMDSHVKVVGADFAYNQECGTSGLTLRAGVTFYANEADVYKGVTFAAREKLEGPIQPFVGIGVFGGEGVLERSKLADRDGVDNDGDGVVDEPGERNTFKSLSIYAYPEVGFIFKYERFGLTMSARQYWGLGDGVHSAVVYNIGFITVLDN